MIAAGFLLFAIGAADLVREFAPAARRWIGYVAVGLVLLVSGALSSALPAALAAALLAAGWVWLTPSGTRSRAGLWPVVVVGALSATLVAFFPARSDAGLIGEVWNLESPVGPLSFDHAVLLIGTALFLLESRERRGTRGPRSGARVSLDGRGRHGSRRRGGDGVRPARPPSPRSAPPARPRCR